MRRWELILWAVTAAMAPVYVSAIEAPQFWRHWQEHPVGTAFRCTAWGLPLFALVLFAGTVVPRLVKRKVSRIALAWAVAPLAAVAVFAYCRPLFVGGLDFVEDWAHSGYRPSDVVQMIWPVSVLGAFLCGAPIFGLAFLIGRVSARLSSPSGEVVTPHPEYGGFWMRLCAGGVDGAVLFEVVVVLISLVPLDERGWSVLIAFLVPWLYFALLESSPWQATLGKKLLGLAVTDLEGKRISFQRATSRFWWKLPALPWFVTVGVTEKKRAVHDRGAGTLVVSRA